MESIEIPSLKFGSTQKLLFVLCGGGWAIAMGVVATISILINEIHDEWGLSYSLLSLIPTSNMTGIFFGSYIWGSLSDKFGRMIAFKRALLLCCIATAASVFSVNIYMLIILFLFIGFGLAGSLAVDGAVFLEYISPDKSYLLTGMSVVCAFGGMYATGSAWMFSVLGFSNTWRYVLAVNAILNLFIVIPRFWIKETPLFLISKGRILEAESLIGEINKSASTAKENINQSLISRGTEPILLSISDQAKILFRPPLKNLMIKYLIVMIIQIWSFTAFTFSGVGNFMPEIMRQAGEGSSSNTDIYKNMFIQNLSIRNLGAIPAVLVATYLVKSSLGRKYTQVLSLFMASLLLFSFLIPNYIGLMIFSTIYFFFINVMYPVQYAITPETFPIQVRNTAVGLCNSVNNIASIIGPFAAAFMLEGFNELAWCLLVFSCSLIVAAVCGLFVIETRDFDSNSFKIGFDQDLKSIEPKVT